MSDTSLGPPYKNATGRFYIKNLFYERQYTLPVEDRVIRPVFSLNGHPDYIHFKGTFVETRDPTGYKWAMKYLKSWKHWGQLCQATWFQEALEEAREELKACLKSEAIQKVIKIASSDSPQALVAAKYLACAEFDRPVHGRGRPSGEEIKGALRKAVQSWSTEQEDAVRIGLKPAIIGDTNDLAN